MKQLTTTTIQIFAIYALAIFISSCSSESSSNATKTKSDKDKDELVKEESIKMEVLDSTSVGDETFILPYKQVSNGLEYKVAQYFQDQYNKGELNHVVKGIGRKMDPEKNKVYLDTKLFSNNGLGFFLGKYPEFLEPTADSIINPKKELITNTMVNCLSFVEGKASDYLLNRENYKIGDLQIIISKAFYFRGHYYVHAWLINASTKVYHRQQTTFKFDKSEEIIDHSSPNNYQAGYSTASEYLKSLDTPVQVVDF